MMSKPLCAALSSLALALCSASADATLIASWDFGPTSLAGAPSSWSTTSPVLPADEGAGTLEATTNSFRFTGVQPLASQNSTLSTPDDDTAGLRIFLDTGRRGTYEISFSTIGLEDIQFQLDFSRNSGGFGWGGVGVRNNVGQSTGVGPMVQTASWDRASYDLSSIAAINDQPNVTLLINVSNSPGNDVVVGGAIDNLVITGSRIVPEPSAALLAGGLLLLGATRQRG